MNNHTWFCFLSEKSRFLTQVTRLLKFISLNRWLPLRMWFHASNFNLALVAETRSDNSMAVAHGRYDPQLIIWLANRTGAPTTAMHCDAPRTCHKTCSPIGGHKYSRLLIGKIWSSCTDGPISPQILAKLMVLKPWLCHVIQAHQCMVEACFWPIEPSYYWWRPSGFWTATCHGKTWSSGIS